MSKRAVHRAVDELVRFASEETLRQSRTVSATALKAGLAGNTVSVWKSGKASPLSGNLRAYLNVLGYDIGIVNLGEDRVRK